MKILFLTRRFWPDTGGVEKHVLEISKNLAAQGHKITIITQSKNSNKKELPLRNIKIIRIPRHGKNNEKIFTWRWFWKNKNVLQDADVIHCHDVFYWYFPFRFLYPKKPVFTTFHGYESFPIKKKAIIVRKVSEVLSFGNICIGDFITKWYYTKPTAISYGAVDTSKFNVQNSKSDQKYSAVFFGRLDEQTGIQTYVHASSLIKKYDPHFELLVVGDGKYKKKIEKDVTVLGFKQNIEKYLHESHFAFVSRYLSILEAFAAKRLVFAVYDNPIKEDYLKMAPFAKFIVTATTSEELSKKVIFYLTHPEEEKKLVEKAFVWVQKQNWEKMKNTYIALWNAL